MLCLKLFTALFSRGDIKILEHVRGITKFKSSTIFFNIKVLWVVFFCRLPGGWLRFLCTFLCASTHVCTRSTCVRSYRRSSTLPPPSGRIRRGRSDRITCQRIPIYVRLLEKDQALRLASVVKVIMEVLMVEDRNVVWRDKKKRFRPRENKFEGRFPLGGDIKGPKIC